jgi:hypothetical protein
MFAFLAIVSCDAFGSVSRPARSRHVAEAMAVVAEGIDSDMAKVNFLNALDRPYDLNAHSETRTNLLDALIDSGAGLPNPGSKESFASVAPGIWRVVYAPHMTTIERLFQGELSVQVS